MNLLRFLTSKKGAIKPLNALLISGAAGVGFFFVANTAANRQIEAERHIRTLGELAQTAPQQGMHQQGGMLTSINVRDGLNQLATAEERAAMAGESALDRYNANQRALQNMESSLGNMDVGQAAQLSGAESGLGADNREAMQENVRLSVGNPRVSGAGPSSYDYKDAAESQGGGSSQLTKASMAHASGGSSSSSYNPGARDVPGRNSGTLPGSEGPRRLSGAMPSGTNVMSQMGLEGATARGDNTASFGKDRNARGTKGRRTGQGKDELDDILKKSAALAVKPTSANAGGRAFMNGSTVGGIAVEGETNAGTATSSDLAAPTANKLKAIGNRLRGEDNKQEERNRKQRQLIAQLLATAVGSALLIIWSAKQLQKLDPAIKLLRGEVAKLKASLLAVGLNLAARASIEAVKKATEAKLAAAKLRRRLITISMLTLVTGANVALFIMAKKFESNYGAYGGTAIAAVARVVSALTVAAAVQTAITPSWKGFMKTTWATIKGGFKSVALNSVTKM